MTNDMKPTDGKLISGYLLQYCVSQSAIAIHTLMRDNMLGVNPGYYFEGVDQKVMHHLIANNGLGDWAKFTAQNQDVQKRLEEIGKATASVDYTQEALQTWCELHKEQYKGREASKALEQARAALKAGKASEALMMLEQQAGQILADAPSAGIPDGKTVGKKTRERLKARLHGGDAIFVRTGFDLFDRTFGGFERGALNGLVGIPGASKTAFAGQCMYQQAQQGYVPLMIQMEMQPEEMQEREAFRQATVSNTAASQNQWAETEVQRLTLLLNEADNDRDRQKYIGRINELNKQRITPEQEQALFAAVDTLERLPVLIDNTGNPDVYHIIAKCREAITRYGKLDVVYIDNIGLMSSTTGLNKNDANYNKNIVGELKQLLTPLFPDTAFVVIQHLNGASLKTSADNKIVVDQGDLEGQTARHYHQVFCLTRPVMYKKQLKDVFEGDNWDALSNQEKRALIERCIITPIKNRSGEPNRELQCRFIGSQYSFTNMEVI